MLGSSEREVKDCRGRAVELKALFYYRDWTLHDYYGKPRRQFRIAYSNVVSQHRRSTQGRLSLASDVPALAPSSQS